MIKCSACEVVFSETGYNEHTCTGARALDKQEAGSHYKDLPIQPVEFCQKNQLNYCESNVIKYVIRHKDKNGLEDLKKAKHYIEMLMEMEYGED